MAVKKKIIYAILIIWGCLFSACRKEGSNAEIEELYLILDQEIAKSKGYEGEKEATLTNLKNELVRKSSPEEKIPIVEMIINQYDTYNSDSIIYYVDENIRLMESEGISDARLDNLYIRKAQFLASSGLIQDAMDMLRKIDSNNLSDDSKALYYNAYVQLYLNLIEYTGDNEISRKYEDIRNDYIDSLLNLTDPNSAEYVVIKAPHIFWQGETQKSLEMLQKAIGNYMPGERTYSILAFLISYFNHQLGNEEEYEKYLILSAISDTKGVIKENVSFSQLASIRFEKGDIDRANLYIEKSFDDANFFSSRIRSLKAGQILPIIDKAYIDRQENFHIKLRGYIISISLLAALLLISFFFILKQYKKIKGKNVEIESKNKELLKLNENLSVKDSELIVSYKNLEEAYRIKEEYLNAFMRFASNSVSNMSEYLLSLKKYVNSSNKALLLQKIDSNKVAESIMEEFFNLFDSSFLKLYPDFIEKVNNLLKKEEKIILKPSEKLNPELRMLALMNLGITELSSIAEFLHYSIATVYTYRSKLKKRAMDSDKFEQDIIDLYKNLKKYPVL